MNHLITLFAGYQLFLKHLLATVGGPWASLLVGIIDSAAFGIPLDPVVCYNVYQDQHRAFLYIVLVSLGSMCGATIPYLMGRKGGEKLVLKHIGKEQACRIQSLVRNFGAFALFIPAILLPPTPFKLFEFSAGVVGLKYPRFLAAVFCGRIVRFSILALLTLRFGQQAVGFFPSFLHSHWRTVLVVGIGAVCFCLARKLFTQRRSPMNVQEETAQL